MEIAQALDFFRTNGLGTLATLRADGSPHLSVVNAAVVEGRLWISSAQTRVKTANVRRTGKASFAAGTGPWAAVDGAAAVDDGEGLPERLRLYYRTAAGEHPDWDEYDRAMIEEQRVLIVLEPHRAYGLG